ncbi:MAG TPA: hypothetical protein VJZ71_20845 [Phycisphaerae bacterium]|nr:hypothetical protein [Phycisphaerae bacterium]
MVLPTIVLASGSGCPPPRGDPPSAISASLTRADEILDKCITAHNRLSTLQVKGVLSDFRHGTRRVVPLSWDLSRPSRCRLQIDRDVAIVSGAECWTYRSATGRFQGGRSPRAAPIEAAAMALSDDVPFLLPALWEDRSSALGKDQTGGFPAWRLQGVAWSGDRPCYVFARRIVWPVRKNVQRLWIDQDELLIRRWSVVDASEDGRERTIVECAYHEVVANGRLRPDCFQIQPPDPIAMPGSPGITGGLTDRNSGGPS